MTAPIAWPEHRLSAVTLFLFLSLGAALFGADPSATWLPPRTSGVTAAVQPDGIWQVVSSVAGEYVLDSEQMLAAKPGDCFAMKVRVQAGIDMNALPELACYDAQGREIPIRASPTRVNRFATTAWQSFERVFPALPNTASVRARIRGRGRGKIMVDGLSLQPTQIEPYRTGALISQPHAMTRVDLVLESNFGILNPELVSTRDQDGDGKWALITVDLDQISAPEKKGEDWRSSFEDNPNAILWSDGAVLKSDSVRVDRAPDRAQALHYRTKVHAGPYTVRVSDPGRAVALSLDGNTWRRCEAGDEIALGTLAADDGIVDFWMDACYVDSVTPGPAYFDYVRLTPEIHAPAIDQLLAAALTKPAPITHGVADETKVALTVEAPAFAASSVWPARCGLPLPRGDLVSAEHVAVFNAAGVKIPSQCRVMATWPDASVKWLLLDFMHELSRGAKANYTVAYGNGVKATPVSAPVQVQKTSAGLEVNTGAIQFLVSGSKFGFIENVRLASGRSIQHDPISAEIVESGGRVWRALDLPVARLEVEQAGPLHTIVVMETKLAESGQPATGFYHRARIHAYAGSPLVQVDYFVVNTDSRPAKNVGGSMASKVEVRSMALKLHPTDVMTSVLHDAGPGAAAGARGQKTADVALDTRETGTTEARGRVAGWVAMGLDHGGSLQAGVAGFREQFPKAFRWSPQQLAIDLWAEEGGDFPWIEGVGKTHHVSLWYGGGTPARGELLAVGPVLATPNPEWYVRSGAFGDIVTAPEIGFPAVENSLATHLQRTVIDEVGLGFENYGDHSSNGYVKGTFLWDNNEYDLPAGCMVHFVRTGDRNALRIGLASALHYVDVDVVHYSSKHADWTGGQHTHSHGLFGHHTAGGPDFGHAGYTQGLLWYSYLTGDPAGIDGARGIADWCLSRLGSHTGGMERVLGHPLMTLNDAYEATGDAKYLRGSAHLVDQALKWEHPLRSGFLAPITESPAYYSGSPFCNGVISAGLIKFNGWANLPEVDAMLERVARWTLTDAYRSPLGLANKGGSPRRTGSPQHIANQGRLMAQVYARTQDPLYLVVPAKLASEGYGANSRPIFGPRSTGLVYNYLPWLLAALHAQGNPAPDPHLEVAATSESLTLAPGGKTVASFTVKNTGAQPVEDLRVSFHTRLDFATATLKPLPARLPPGQTAECSYEVEAPAQINLSCDYNRVAYGHWSALYRRADRAHLAHVPVKLMLKSPGVVAVEQR